MLIVDSNEPEEMVRLLKQSCPVVVSPLNQMHMSDYFFGNYEGKTFQYSRKQAPELLGDLDEAERQIRDYYGKADYNFQIVEGLVDDMAIKDVKVSGRAMSKISTRPQPSMFAYKIGHDRSLEGYSFDRLHTISIVYAWEHRLMMAGVPTIFVADWQQTAKFLSAAYHNEQKPPDEHMTLKRIILPRLQVKEQDPFLKSLLFLSNAYKLEIGEKRGKALADKFVNILDLCMADVAEISSVEGIGTGQAKKILKALGRDIE